MNGVAPKILSKKYMPIWFEISVHILFKVFSHLKVGVSFTFYPSLASNYFKQLCVSLIAPSSISSGQSGGHNTLAPK